MVQSVIMPSNVLCSLPRARRAVAFSRSALRGGPASATSRQTQEEPAGWSGKNTWATKLAHKLCPLERTHLSCLWFCLCLFLSEYFVFSSDLSRYSSIWSDNRREKPDYSSGKELVKIRLDLLFQNINMKKLVYIFIPYLSGILLGETTLKHSIQRMEKGSQQHQIRWNFLINHV